MRDLQGRFAKGHIPWSKGKNGICLNTGRTHFQKGQHPSPSTEFQRGRNTWNKGLRKINISAEKFRVLYHEEQLTTIAIAQMFNVSSTTIYRYLKKYGLLRGKKRNAEILWDKKDYRNKVVRNTLRSLLIRPNNPEKKAIKIIQKNCFPFEYTGDGSFVIDGKCPDFTATNGALKVIEIFGRAFHDPKISFKEVPYSRTYEGTLSHYIQNGYDCLIFWDDELNDIKKVTQRIEAFIND